jgi:CheY-like chemotaxis protein
MPTAPVRVMLIEDNPDHAELVRRVLDEDGASCEIVHFSDGKEALDCLFGRGDCAGLVSPLPHVILLDLRLTRVDGLEVLRAVKRHEELRAVPVVVLTSSEASRDIAQAYQEHVNSYLVKPVGYEEFRKLMADIRHYWLEWNTAILERRIGGLASP